MNLKDHTVFASTLLVVEAELGYFEHVSFYPIHHAMLFGNSTGPKAAEGVLERFGLADSLVWAANHVSN